MSAPEYGSATAGGVFLLAENSDSEKGGKLDEAVHYSLNQKDHLTAFLEAPEVPISNNLAENAIRPFVLSNKNWLLSGSGKGAESNSIVYSLVETAKANSGALMNTCC